MAIVLLVGQWEIKYKPSYLQRIFGQQDVVEPLTAGIIPHQVDSPYSNMVIYDLAGHHQYFSSHSACLEAISLNSPAIFLLLQDLRKDSEAITKEFYYWSTMMDGVCHKCPQPSQVIVVGTHADQLSAKDRARKLSHLQSVANAAIAHQKLVKVVSLDLTKMYRDEMDQLMSLLHETNKEVISMCPSISMMCHMILAFLKERLPPNMDAITLSDLHERIKADKDNLIGHDISDIISHLWTLSEKGLISYIPAIPHLSSWIVLHKETILKRVNGALFADPTLKEYTHIASNTGIVSRAVLEKTFPEYNVDMIIQFMIHFELCQVVDLSLVDTNMAPEGSPNTDLGPYFFFPALVCVDRPSSAVVPSNSFGWSMLVRSPYQFFTPRFLHVLLRRLPFEFAFATVQATPVHPHIQRRCDVWSRGIKWLSQTGGVTTIVEMSDKFQSISMAMSSSLRTGPKYLELVHTVISFIKKARQEFCPHVEVLEIISCPPEAISDHSDGIRVELSLLMKALHETEQIIFDVSGQKHVVIGEWMKIEPCLPYLVGGEAVGRCGFLWVTSPFSSRVYFCGRLYSSAIVRHGRPSCATVGRLGELECIILYPSPLQLN